MRDPLRVVVVSSLSIDSGSHLRARQIANGLRRAGAHVVFVNGIRSLPLMLHYPVSFLLYLRVLFIQCDVIIGLKPLPNVGILLLVKKLFGTLTVVDIDDVDFGFRSGLVSTVNRLLQLPIPKRCDLVTYHTDRLRPFIRETFSVGDNKLFQLPQGVDVTPPGAGRTAGQARRERFASDGKLVVYTAHLNIASDLDAILEIIRIAHARVPNLRFLVIGGGPRERRFRRIARELGVDRVTTFTGYVPPHEVADYLMLGDAAVVYYKDIEVNYFRESMKLREMLGLGLKVVCNDVGDLKRFAEYTYQVDSDHQAVAQELVRVLETGGDGREARGKAYVDAHLNWNQIGERLFRRLLDLQQVGVADQTTTSAAGGLG
jgi:glycosyltransferase involved in cell wall biosynthesis